jgi:hypothetical protein
MHDFDYGFENLKFTKAFDESKELVDISFISSGESSRHQNFVCVGCGGILKPRLGSKNRHHFYHVVNKNCSRETYLHKLGKKIFFDEFQRRKQLKEKFTLVIPSTETCSKFKAFNHQCVFTNQGKESSIDLITAFPEIFEETLVDSFIPDLYLLNPANGKKVFIEIVVSNPPSENKINSGIPIIRIDVDAEGDLDFISKGVISWHEGMVQLYNLSISNLPTTKCFSNCRLDEGDKIYYKFLLTIKDAFDLNSKRNEPFYFEYCVLRSCSFFVNQFGNSCDDIIWRQTNLIKHYNSCDISWSNKIPYLIFHHKNDGRKNLLISSNRIIWSEEYNVIFFRGHGLENEDFKTLRSKISMRDHFLNPRYKDTKKEFFDCSGNCQKSRNFLIVKSNGGAMISSLKINDLELV